MPKYSIGQTDPEKTARAYGYELHCSPKDSINIAHALRGMRLIDAKKYLEDVIALKRAVPFRTHKKKVSHRKGMGPGRYPRKAAKYILDVLKNAENNAEYKGLSPEDMVITHIAAYKGREIEGIMPRAYGRATQKNEQTTNIEVVIEEVE
ncbi:MAG TPA: 50S ribosomal protein L22 [Thermoplasmatales archaeon]|nr:50S ribosomal protein L22 [Thermoplasmata archaeon]RLF45997.1 MAG: 50S ribosomal protein L22 [Thermoplasmata archaeon]HEB37067.1 50S ribosomal protein L22 [Thermoplasmatales archaeon]